MPYRLTIVDNGSKSETRDYLQYLYKKSVIDDLFLFEKNMGVSCGYNFALAQSNSPYFVRLDNDVIIQDSLWADVLVRVLSRRELVGTVGFQFNDKPECVDDDGFTFIQKAFTGGACCMSRRDIHEKLGFWCEDYGIYGEEDSDFGLRLGLVGHVSGVIEYGNRFLRHEHTLYDTDEVEPLRRNENRKSALKTFFLNKFMYENKMRSVFMARKYDPIVDGIYVSFRENEKYRLFLDEVESLKAKIGPALQFTVHEFFRETGIL